MGLSESAHVRAHIHTHNLQALLPTLISLVERSNEMKVSKVALVIGMIKNLLSLREKCELFTAEKELQDNGDSMLMLVY